MILFKNDHLSFLNVLILSCFPFMLYMVHRPFWLHHRSNIIYEDLFMGKATDRLSTWSSQVIMLSSWIFVSFAITSLYSNYVFLIVWRRKYFPCSLHWPLVGGRTAGDTDANLWTSRRQTSSSVRAKAERPRCVNQCEGRVHSQFRVYRAKGSAA